MGEVVGLPGVDAPEQPATQQPQPDVIARLEVLLERAKSGEIQAIAYGYVNESGNACEGWTIGNLPTRVEYALGFALNCLQHRYFAHQAEVGKDIPAPGPEPA
jgi:hypothetical protein